MPMPISFASRAAGRWPTTVAIVALHWLSAVVAEPVSAQPTPGAKAVTAADIAFMKGMIGHHAQAVEMTALLPTRSSAKTMALLGERISVSQRDEIAMMSEWLRTHGATVPAITPTPSASHPMAGHAMPGHDTVGHQMPGMLSPAQMDTLRAATGGRFDRLFLRYMIQHHEGALDMVRSLLGTNGAAQEPQLFGFASDVDTDQRAEIRRMQQLLKTISTPTTNTRR